MPSIEFNLKCVVIPSHYIVKGIWKQYYHVPAKLLRIIWALNSLEIALFIEIIGLHLIFNKSCQQRLFPCGTLQPFGHMHMKHGFK